MRNNTHAHFQKAFDTSIDFENNLFSDIKNFSGKVGKNIAYALVGQLPAKNVDFFERNLLWFDGDEAGFVAYKTNIALFTLAGTYKGVSMASNLEFPDPFVTTYLALAMGGAGFAAGSMSLLVRAFICNEKEHKSSFVGGVVSTVYDAGSLITNTAIDAYRFVNNSVKTYVDKQKAIRAENNKNDITDVVNPKDVSVEQTVSDIASTIKQDVVFNVKSPVGIYF